MEQAKKLDFHFTATLAADDNYMAEESIINLGYSKDNYRFMEEMAFYGKM